MKLQLNSLLDYLIVGTIGMIILALIRKKKYELSAIKAIVSMLFLAVAGVIGAFTLFYIENGYWGGQSYFGAVIIAPIIMLPVALILKISYTKLLGYCAPAECVMLAILKLHCMQSKCCSGSPMFDIFSIIPLQLIESCVAIMVMIILIYIEYKKNDLSRIYAWYLAFYGTVRFILNSYRSGLQPYAFNLPAGHFWAIVSVIFGCIWLLKIKPKVINTSYKE